MQNPFELVVRIMWSAFKQTTSDWADIRNNTKVHTFYWIHEGKGIFYTNRRHDVYQGMLFYMKPGTPMKMESAEGAPLAISMILFECCELTYTESRWHMPELVHQLPIPLQAGVREAVEWNWIMRSIKLQQLGQWAIHTKNLKAMRTC